MARQSIDNLLAEYIERFFGDETNKRPFFNLEDMVELISISTCPERPDKKDNESEFYFNLIMYSLMSGYMKGYKQAATDIKKGNNALDKPLKYANKGGMAALDIADDIMAKRVAEVLRPGKPKASKSSTKKSDAGKAATKKFAVKKSATAVKKTSAKKPSTKKAVASKSASDKKSAKKTVKKTTKK